MTRAELRLRLIEAAHHPSRDHKQTIEIVRDYEAAFDDLTLDDEGDKPRPAQGAPAQPRTKKT